MKPDDKAYREFMRVYNKTHVSLEAQVMASLTAAYAAQFQSEECAGLIERLRNWGAMNYKECDEAADAIEALMAERDAEREHYEKLLCERTTSHMQQMKAAKSERDSLAARLAPVEDEALVEIVAVYCSPEMNWNEMSEKWKNSCRRDARAAIAAIRPHIEAAERERCAKIVELDCDIHSTYAIAAAIRSGK